MTALRKFAVNMGYRYTSREAMPPKAFLWPPKIITPSQKSGVIYRYTCDGVECDNECIRKSARTFGERIKEYFQPPSTIHEHST